MGRPENAFLNNFMQGFSFVDQIKRQKKADARLETRLKEEREERSYQRRRQQRADQKLDTIFKNQLEDRADANADEEKAEEGARIALNPDTTNEELQAHAPYSPEAAAELKRRVEKDRLTGAITNVQTIGQGNQATASPNGPSLSEAVAATGAPTQEGAGKPTPATGEQPAMRVEGNQFQFGRDRGVSGMQEVDVDEASQFDPEYQKKGLIAKGGDKLAGLGAEVTRGFGDIAKGVINAPAKIRGTITGEGDFGLGTQNVGDEFGGNLLVPADRYTSPAEFEEMAADGASQAEISAARAENQKVLAEYSKAGRRAASFIPSSRQGALLEGSDQARRQAEAAQNQVLKRATSFLDPTQESAMEQLAMEDPRAATVMYLQDRATLEGADPNLAVAMDQRMIPIIDAAEQDMRAEIQTADPNSLKARQQMRALGNLHNARDAIYKGQPSISAQAEINKQGLKVGDQPRAESVVDTIFSPDRVVPTHQSPATVRTAATVAGRITANKRLNATQIDSLATLAQAGWIDKNTAMSVMMTGTWPPGQDPAAIAKIQEAGGNVYAITKGGQVHVLQQGKGTLPDPAPSREIGEDQFQWVSEGIRSQFPNIDDNGIKQMQGIMMKNPGWVRSRFNVTSQEDMRRFGIILAESKIMAGKKFAELDDGWFTNTKNAPTWEEILMDPDMRDAIANEFEMEYTPLPDVKDLDGIDDEGIRQSVREGRAGPTAAANADRYTSEQIKEVFARSQLLELDRAGRLQVNDDGTYTILPAPEGQ